MNIEKDFAAEPDRNGYIITPTARKALRRILEGIQGDSSCRALTLTGPYGVGKSAFALYITRLFCGDPHSRNSAMGKLQESDPSLAHALRDSAAFEHHGMGFFPVLITARRIAAPLCVLEGIAHAASSSQSKKLKGIGSRLLKQTQSLAPNRLLDSRTVVEELSALAAAATASGYAGTLLVIDELGKLFEFAGRDSQKGDVYILQEIAEQAARSAATPLISIGLLHQGFDEYARHLDLATRQEWAKIQGRYTDIAYQEPTEQVVRLLASAIALKSDALPASFNSSLQRLAKVSVHSGIKPSGMANSEFEDIACRCYPLHPTALVALPILFTRFAQNERSLFSYLSSLEPGSFQEFIRSQPLDPKSPAFIRLPQLFDYFSANFGAGLYRQPHARRWLEAADALERREDLNNVHRDLVKTVGVLSVLGDFSHLRANAAVLACALDDSDRMSSKTADGIKYLRECSLLTYRKFNDTYRVWEGSDIDIEERIAEGVRKVSRTGLAGIVQRYLVTRPLVARRHSFETGALRYFEITYVDQPSDIAFPDQEARQSDGQVIVCLAESAAQIQEFRRRATDPGGRPDILFAIPQDIGDLRAAALELAALRWTWENTPELRDDRVARREVALRITDAEQLLQRNLAGLLDPRPEPEGRACLWFFEGKKQPVRNRADVSHLLSDVADALYSKTPKIRNELITRRSLSSAAAAARRNLVEAMLTKGSIPMLGIEGFPPERSMYESCLAVTGIHAQQADGSWGFSPPNASRSHNLAHCWKHLCKTIFDRQPEPIAIDALFSELSNPPYGLLDGLNVLVLCAFILVYPDEVTLYREGSFIPEPNIADFEVIMRCPELFAIAGSRVEGGRAAVVERLAKGLKVAPATVSVVRALFKMVKGFPEFSWKTRRLPAETIALRDAFQGAKSPERFLFVALPEALCLPAFDTTAPRKEAIESFFSTLNLNMERWASCAGQELDTARDRLLEACGLPAGDDGWEMLRRECLRLERGVTEPQLLTFVRRVTHAGSSREGVDSVISLVASRPPMNWDDIDAERFSDAASAVGASFRAAAKISADIHLLDCRVENLDTREQREAEAIVKDLRDHLKKHHAASSRLIAAALVSLARRLQHDIQATDNAGGSDDRQ